MTTFDIISITFFLVLFILMGIYVITYIQMNCYKSVLYLTREEKDELISLINLNLESFNDDKKLTDEELQEIQLCINLRNKLMIYV